MASLLKGAESLLKNLVTAEKFTPNEENLQCYAMKVRDEWTKTTDDGVSLPAITETVTWTVYRMHPSGKYRHHSLLFVCDDSQHSSTKGFTFELRYEPHPIQISPDIKTYRMIPHTDFLDPNNHKSEQLAKLIAPANIIMAKGLECLENFGDYYEIGRNCQDFCKEFAGVLRVEQLETDAEVTGRVAAEKIGEMLNVLWNRKQLPR